MTAHKPDGEDLQWLARNLRSAYLETQYCRRTVDFWLTEITNDFGPEVAQRIDDAVKAEVELHAEIEAARRKWLGVRSLSNEVIRNIAAEVDA